MKTNNLVGMILAVMVGVVCIGTVLMPTLSDATQTEDTFTNEGYFNMRYTETDNVTLVWSYQNPHQVTVNDEVVSLDSASGMAITVMTGDDWFLRYNGFNAIAIDSTIATFGANVSNSQTLTIVASEGTATATLSAEGGSTSSKTYTYTYLYTIDNDGDFVMKLPTAAAYLNADSQIYAVGGSVLFTNVYTLIKSSGSYDDEITSTVFKPTSGYTVTDVDPNFEEVNDHIDLYTLDSFVITVSNGDTTDTATYSYFLVPYQVTAEKVAHFSNVEIGLLMVIPIMVILAVMMIAVRSFARYD